MLTLTTLLRMSTAPTSSLLYKFHRTYYYLKSHALLSFFAFVYCPPTHPAPPSVRHLVGSHPIFGAFLPVAAVQAVEAAGPDKAAARGLGHGKGLEGGTLGSQRPWQKGDPSLPPSEEPSRGGAEAWATAQHRRLQGRLQVPDWRRR